MRFIHCSDLHLGTNRFGNDKLTKDFATSFQHMAEDAIRRNVDAVVISGDFFNKASIDPTILLDAERILSILQNDGVEVIAVEGNHDASIYSQQISWLHFLSHRGLLKLLQIRYTGGQAVLNPWSADHKIGGHIDVEGVRFYGLGYLGASSSKKLDLLKDAIEPAEFTVAMLHAGIDMFNDMDMGGARKSDVELLKEKVNYVALGHVHGRYSIDDWMHNPGGLENWRPEECTRKKGYFLVDVRGGKARVKTIDSTRRPGYIVNVDVSELGTEADVSREIRLAVESLNIDPATGPILSVKLTGKPCFDLFKYDGRTTRDWIISQTSAVECLINDQTSFNSVGRISKDRLGKHEVERQVIGELLRGKDIPNLNPEEKVDLALKFKSLSLAGEYDKMEKTELLRDLVIETLTTRRG